VTTGAGWSRRRDQTGEVGFPGQRSFGAGAARHPEFRNVIMGTPGAVVHGIFGFALEFCTPFSFDVVASVTAASSVQRFELDWGASRSVNLYTTFALPNRDCYIAPAAYLKTVRHQPAHKRLARLRTGSRWLREELGHHQRVTRQRESRVCQRCDSDTVDDTRQRLMRSMHICLECGRRLGSLPCPATQPADIFVLQCFDNCNAFLRN